MTSKTPAARLATLLAPVLISMLAACGGGGANPAAAADIGPCASSAQKTWLLDVVRDWYLFPETLPANVSVSHFTTARDLLDHLTAGARSQGRDRDWSYLTTLDADQTRFLEGQYAGYGFALAWQGSSWQDARLVVRWSFTDSPAWNAGLLRGAEITAIDDGRGFRTVRDIAAQGNEAFAAALGPSEVGVRRGFRWTQDGTPYERYLAQALVTIEAVPSSGGVRVLPRAGTTGVGYIHLLSFIDPAEAPLREAFDQFRRQDIRDFIIDLRYNGGGLVTTLHLLGNLMAAARSTGEVFARQTYSPRHADLDSAFYFEPQAESVAPLRIAFITTDSSASASEAIVNLMKPYAQVAIIGSDTYGKPVGQVGLPMQGCDTLLRLVGVRLENAYGEGDYYHGLADTLPGAACGAWDDLDRMPGNSAEASTQEAMSWLGNGYCGSPMWSAKASPPTWSAQMRRMPRSLAQEALPDFY